MEDIDDDNIDDDNHQHDDRTELETEMMDDNENEYESNSNVTKNDDNDTVENEERKFMMDQMTKYNPCEIINEKLPDSDLWTATMFFSLVTWWIE